MLFQATRPQFLVLTPICFMVGGAWALKQNSSTNLLYLMMAMVGAIAAHVAVNTLNDYFDFKSGLDLLTKPTPFSGGSGMLPGEKLEPKTVLALGLGSLAVAVAVGALFMAIRGWELLIITVPAGLLIILYTQYITRFPWLCLMVPGVAFGPLMATGAFYALSGTFNTTVLAASVVPGFLVSGLLLLNQFPDVEADRASGRRVLPVVIGKPASARLFAVLMVSMYLWIIVSVVIGLLPIGALLALLSSPLAFITAQGALRHAEEHDTLIPFLGRNVVLTLLTPALLTIGSYLTGF